MAKRAPARPRPRKAKPGTKGLDPAQCRLEQSERSAAEATRAVEKAGGCVVGLYKDPLGGHPTLLSILPIDKVEPTPFERDLSDAHHKRLADVIRKTGRFLDPLITVVAPGGGFWTPNGRHRLEAMRRLGAKSITALVVPEREVAWQILALNTEKAHKLKERSLEVIRIYRGLIDEDGSRPESGFSIWIRSHWSLWGSATNESHASVEALTIRSFGALRTLATSHTLVRCGAHQPVALDQRRPSASRRCSEDNARACSEVQR
jgi:ParB family transcriptional regulator, chromosome partitioning protein